MPFVSVNYADTIELLEHLGDIVKREREERGLSLREAACEIGIGFRSLWDVEQGFSGPRCLVIVKLLRWMERG